MTKRQKINSLILVLTSFIWGLSFVSQSEGGDAIGPISFNCVRCYVGATALFIVIKILDRIGLTHKPADNNEKKNLYIGGICCGIVFTLATSFQQFGITLGTASGKAGFLTANYILLVPILGIFLGKKSDIKIWLCVIIALVGLYLLCINGKFVFQISDVLVIICALLFAMHILFVEHFSPLVDGVRLSCLQFVFCALTSTIPMLIFEVKPFQGGLNLWLSNFRTMDAWGSLLYAGVMSCGVAYTLQIIGQQDMNPTIASLLMSLESVFSVLAGWVILHEYLTKRELFGCVLIFVAIILAQIPIKIKKGEKYEQKTD